MHQGAAHAAPWCFFVLDAMLPAMATVNVAIHTISQDPAPGERAWKVRELAVEVPPSAGVDEAREAVRHAVLNLNLGPIRSLSAVAGGGWSVVVRKR